MKIFTSCSDSVSQCMNQKRFGISHLTSEIPTNALHIHSCHEIHYSIAGGRRFFIADQYYEIEAGDVFLIPCNVNHHIIDLDYVIHDRINIAIHPFFLEKESSQETDLSSCFELCGNSLYRIKLGKKEQKQLEFLIFKIENAEGYGKDLREDIWMKEIMIMLNEQFALQNQSSEQKKEREKMNFLIVELISYINNHIREDLGVQRLAKHFFVSESYLCRSFKAHTGLTINNYIKARRIGVAKSLMDMGYSASESCEKSGFTNYTTFYKSFVEIVGVAPQKYLKYR